MKVAILGGGSCFALNLATHLCSRGDQVTAISRSPLRGAAFSLGLENEAWFEFKALHLVTELDDTMRELDKYEPEVIVNFAALCELNYSWKYPLNYFNTNTMAMVALVDALQSRDWLKRFVQVGTSEVYGNVDHAAYETDPIRCSSPYAASKAAFDLHLEAVARHQKFPALIVRPSNGYCEGQWLNRIIPKTIISAMTGKKLQLQGGGAAKKSYLHADDISSAIMLLMEKGEFGEVYNCGPLWPISIREAIELIAGMLGKSLGEVADIAPERVGQDGQYWLNSNKIRAIGWEPKVALHEGFPRVIEWVRRYPELLTADTGYEHRA